MSITTHYTISAALSLLAASVLPSSGAHAKTLRTVGLAFDSLDNPFFKTIIGGITAEAKSINPSAHIEAAAASHNPKKQFAQIDGFVASGVNVIILDPLNHDAMLPAIRRAQKAGVAVVAVHFPASGVDAMVGNDEVASGKLSCQALAHAIGGKGNVIIESGPSRISAVGDRVRGCKESLAVHPAITLLPSEQDGKGSQQGGLAVMQDELARYPVIAGVFTISEPEALGAQVAIKQAHRDHIDIATVGGGPDFIAALKAPNTELTATAALDPYAIGELAMKNGALIFDGEKPAKRVTLMAPKLIDRNNAGSYSGWMQP